MRVRSFALQALAAAPSLALAAVLGGCGQTGPLVMPDTDTSSVIIRPSATPASEPVPARTSAPAPIPSSAPADGTTPAAATTPTATPPTATPPTATPPTATRPTATPPAPDDDRTPQPDATPKH